MEEKMTVDERYKYFRMMHQRYDQASRSERSRLLDEMESVTGKNRKYICHLMNKSGPVRKRRTKQRSRVYGADVDDAIRVIGETLDWICAERMTPELATMARKLAHDGEMIVTDELLTKLESISIATVKRIVARVRQDEYRLPQRRGRRRKRNSLTAKIPTGIIPWDEPEPGHFEVDTVLHCGDDAHGDVVCTLQWIDVKTGWSERKAILGRGQERTRQACAEILERCPISVVELHPDNGPEFMNHHLIRFFEDKVKGVRITRSRPYNKNDNRFVEQKNATLVRAYLGDMRLHTEEQRAFLDAIYEDMWLYYNFFQPVMRQISKETIRDEDNITRVRRKHDTARTPLVRLLETNVLTTEDREYLEMQYEETNPRALRRRIETNLAKLWAMAG